MNLLLRLREKFWFLPAILCLAAFVLAQSLVRLDQTLGDITPGPVLDLFVVRVGGSGSRDILGTIGASALAVAGTTFSITMAVLALTSSTYGPRLVRNFMVDRGNQLVLGVYVATFLYSLLVLRSVRVIGDPGAQQGDVFVPHIAVNVAVLLAILNVGMLVYFIHHISDSIQVATLSSAVRTDLRATVQRLYPELGGRGESEVDAQATAVPDDAAGEGVPVLAEAPGYVQSVREDSLMRTARRYDVLLALQVRPGQYVLDDTVLAVVHGLPDDDDRAELVDAVRGAFTLANARSPYQDLEFAVQQLTEMAVRALSPGTNDPFTAVNALDDLSSGLGLLAGRVTPSAARYDEQGTIRLYAPRADLTEMVGMVLDAMRWYAASAPSVMHTAVELAERVGTRSSDRTVRARLLGELDLLVDAFEGGGHHERDVEVFRTHVADACREIARAGL